MQWQFFLVMDTMENKMATILPPVHCGKHVLQVFLIDAELDGTN